MSAFTTEAYELPPYGGSTDHRRLAELARRQSIICIVDHQVGDRTIRLLAQTQYQAKGEREFWYVSTPGHSYIVAFNQREFVSLCKHCNVEFIEPHA